MKHNQAQIHYQKNEKYFILFFGNVLYKYVDRYNFGEKVQTHEEIVNCWIFYTFTSTLRDAQLSTAYYFWTQIKFEKEAKQL